MENSTHWQHQWQQRQEAGTVHRRDDHRTPFERDRARILHSAAFRRLQAKTQVHGVGTSDFYRTRLTHSLEVAQIGSGILAQLRRKSPEYSKLLDQPNLIEALCLAHDLGHPPFGHGGEIALHYMMRHAGGFEGNGQTFRILTRLEPYSKAHGMNLSRRTLLGIIKYPQLLSVLENADHYHDVVRFRQLKARDWHPPKAIYDDDATLFEWVLAPLSQADKRAFTSTQAPKAGSSVPHLRTCCKSLDCSIMELADDIAYAVHDLEDAIAMGIVSAAQWQNHAAAALAQIDDPWWQEQHPLLEQQLFSQRPWERKDAIGALVNYFITAVDIGPQQSVRHHFDEPLLQLNASLPAAAAQGLDVLKQFVLKQVIRTPSLQRIEYRGQQMIMELFEAYDSDPQRLLPRDVYEDYQQQQQTGLTGQRAIADYIASLTDDSATRQYQALFVPRPVQGPSPAPG